jgi:methyltransferase OMS1
MWSNFGAAAFLSFVKYGSQTNLRVLHVPTAPIQTNQETFRSLSAKHIDNIEEHTCTHDHLISPSLSRRKIFGTAATIVLFQPWTSSPADAITSSEAETSYDTYAKNYDALDGGSLSNSLGIEDARAKLLQSARGRVLEIGVGTGLNLGKYKFSSSPDASDGVSSLTLVDISDGMMSEAKEKLNSLTVPSHVEIKFVKADATADLVQLFGSGGYFDTVVDTFSLCVMGNDGAKRCLEQMQNVVKKDSGKILLIENTRSSNAALGFYQDLTADAAAKMGGKGCVSNQNARSFIQNTPGLDLISEEEFAAGVFRMFVCKRV